MVSNTDLKKDVPPSLRQRSQTSNLNITEVEKKKVVIQEQRKANHLVQYRSGSMTPTPELTTFGGIKLGWIQGVLIPCLLNIWGVMLFLRISWVVAQAGVGLTIAIIALSSLVCIITTLSLSAICTNGAVAGGGVYYLVSRSLGAEMGASVGLIFAFANAVAASMNTIGFCDSLNELLGNHGLKIIDNGVNDVRIVGAIALFVMCVICAFGMDWETKAQNVLIVIIIIALFNYFIGSFVGPQSESQKAQGFAGLNGQTNAENWLPDFRQGNNFFSIFAIYFPAVTGVQAGANICGDLKNPAEAIPKGTLTALGVSITSYVLMAALAGAGARRDASGRVADLRNGTLAACKPHCKYGLHNNYEIMQLMALWGPLIYGGCWAATLSTALTNLLSVPRLIQALGVDRIYPGLIFFSKPYGRHGEPYRGYVLVFVVSLAFVLIADLDRIAPLITNFYLASYALINFCTFHAAFIHHISWRPTFRFYNTWLSLAGFFMCASIMVVISWLMSLITVVVFSTLYLYVLYRKPATSWGSSTDASRYRETVSSILTMTRQTEAVRDYNPQVLALTGKPSAHTALLDIAHLITKIGSFIIVGEVAKKSRTQEQTLTRKKRMNEWMASRKYRSFYALVDARDFELGARVLVQCAGLGRLAPNILLIGFKRTWDKCERGDLSAYVSVLRYAFEQQLALCILRVPEAPHRPASPALSESDSLGLHVQSRVHAVMHSTSNFKLDDDADDNEIDPVQTTRLSGDSKFSPRLRDANRSGGAIAAPTRGIFYEEFNLDSTGNLDVWWLYDDGGLSILLPYIISDRSAKNKMPLRIFALAREQHDPTTAFKFFEALLAMFRISYTKLSMITGLQDAPTQETWEMFYNLIEDFRQPTQPDNPLADCIITDDDLEKYKEKTTRHLRLRELVLQTSSSAGLIVMSLPVPRQGGVPASLYMAWLEVLSCNLPPILFVRGNHHLVMQA